MRGSLSFPVKAMIESVRCCSFTRNSIGPRIFPRVDFFEYLQTLADSLFRSYCPSGVILKVEGEKVFLGVDTAIPCALLVNELLSNALHHAFPGGRRGTISIVLHSSSDGKLILTIEDNGIGLPGGLDYRNSDNSGAAIGGHARASVESRGRTRYRCRGKIHNNLCGIAIQGGRYLRRWFSQEFLSSRTRVSSHGIIRNCLENLGHTVCGTAASGEEAIRMTADLQPDLVLMDVMLEGDMDGVEAAAYIRKHFETPVVYLTAYADGNTLQRAKVTEPYGYIIKPFEEKEMYTVIEIALYRRSMESKLKKAQEERRQLEARVQYARKQESLIQVVSGIAHRFNNMLGAILGNTELALLELPPDSPVKYTVEQIGKVSLGARDLVRQMVAFTGRRLRTGQKFNLSELILGMRSSIEEAVSGREITVECDLVSPLPDIRGDMVQIRQALMNLIVNAVEAISATGTAGFG